MQKLLTLASLCLLPTAAVLCLRSSAPAQAAPPAQQGLEERVSALESELATEKRRHDETRALLDQTLTYLDQQAKAGQTMLGALAESEKQGFAVGENWKSRETLLGGFRAYWGGQATNLPKAPTPPAPAKPAAPARKPRQ